MIKYAIKKGLASLGYEIRRLPKQIEIGTEQRLFSAIYDWRFSSNRSALEDAFLRFVLAHQHEAQAQLFQDLFVGWVYGSKRSGYFVEFGATDGVTLSNTHWLARTLEWRGLLAEPARGWHDALGRNRPDASIDHRCVWKATGERLVFNETPFRELSTIDALSGNDGHAQARVQGERYEVATVSLNDLLREHGAPGRIDYLSVDTEGSEADILEAFDWRSTAVGVVTVEHNSTANRDRLHRLLSQQGFRRVFETFSRWDDWYVHESLVWPPADRS